MSGAPFEVLAEFTLRGQIPSGKNQQQIAVVNGRVMKFPNARFKKWRDDAWRQVRDQWNKKPTAQVKERAFVQVEYWRGDELRRDVPGMMDALCHLLEWCPACKGPKAIKTKNCQVPVVADDSLLVSWMWFAQPIDRDDPRVVVTIKRAPAESPKKMAQSGTKERP